MKPLGLLLMLCSLASTGFCISCRSCYHMQDSPCDGLSVPCSSDQVCVASYTLITAVTSETPLYVLRCGERSECNVNGSMTSNYGKIRTGTTCCDTDDCAPPFPTLPAVNSRKNGLRCRTSFSETSTRNTSDAVECTVDEIKCGHIVKRQTAPNIDTNDTIHGCATRSYCEILGNQVYTIQGLNIDMKMSCSDGAVALHVGLLGSAVAILLTKLLFYSY